MSSTALIWLNCYLDQIHVSSGGSKFVLISGRSTFLTVIELQHFVVDGGSHGDGLSREVGVVVEPLSHGHACWRIAVSRQKAEHVILSSVSGGGAEADSR